MGQTAPPPLKGKILKLYALFCNTSLNTILLNNFAKMKNKKNRYPLKDVNDEICNCVFACLHLWNEMTDMLFF